MSGNGNTHSEDSCVTFLLVELGGALRGSPGSHQVALTDVLLVAVVIQKEKHLQKKRRES